MRCIKKFKALTPADQSEVLRFEGFLKDSATMTGVDLLTKHREYCGLSQDELKKAIAENPPGSVPAAGAVASVMPDVLENGTKVRHKEAWLARCDLMERRRWEGRVGVVVGYRLGARDPIVAFEKYGRFKAERIFELPSNRLEMV